MGQEALLEQQAQPVLAQVPQVQLTLVEQLERRVRPLEQVQEELPS